MQSKQPTHSTVLANLFPLKFSKQVKLFIHKIVVTPEIRRSIQTEFLNRVLSENEITKDTTWAFDGSKVFISEKNSTTEFEVGTGKSSYKISIEQLEEFTVDQNTKQLTESQMQAIDLIIRSFQNRLFVSCGRKQVITADCQGKVMGTDANNNELRLDINRNLMPMQIQGNVLMAKGIVQATRFLQAGVFLNVDNALQAFYETRRVSEIFKEFDRIRRPEGFRTLMKQCKVVTTHLKRNMTFKPFRVSEHPANNEIFEIEGKSTNVAEYFAKTYTPLENPNMPCVQRKKGDMILSFPIEHLKIAPNQRVPGKLSDQQISDVIKITATPPHQRFRELEDKMKVMNVCENPLLTSLGIKVGTEFTKLPAVTLSPPALKFGDPRNPSSFKFITPYNGGWNLRDCAAIRAVSLKFCTIIDCAGLPRSLIEDKFSLFKSVNKAFRVDIEQFKIVQCRDPVRELDKLIDGFCFVILPAHGRDNKMAYKMVKCISELHKQNSLTQCIKATTFKAMSPSTAANIALKICIKKGGFPNYLDGGFNIFKKPTMVVGIDVSHPGIGQNVGTLAALVSSTDKNCSKYSTFMEFQQARQEVLSNLHNMMGSPIAKFKSCNKGTLPGSVIVFRDGVAASQFSNICDVEIGLIKEAFKAAGMENSKLTYIVCQKKHSIRFMQDGHNPKDSNVSPGTCVMNANVMGRTEFYMISHKAMKGTARPVRYTVLADENKYGEHLQKFIFDLCHMYGRCTKSVGVVSPVYFAHHAAVRHKIYSDNQEAALVNDKDVLFYL